MSIATKRYAGEKGYLDEDDKIIRKYDKDGDGVFTIDDAKSMAADFRRALLSQEMYRKMLIGCGGLLVVSWAGNFGLTYATVALTKQLDTQGGDLTDTAGNIVATKSKGNSGHFYPEYLDPADLRRLQVGTLVPIGTVSTTRADARGIWNDHENGATVSVTYDLDGANHASPVQLGTQELDVPDDVNGTCDVYEGIQVDADSSSRSLKVSCCGADTEPCDAFTEADASIRELTPDEMCVIL